MRRSSLPFSPQPGELGEGRLQALSLRTMTRIARARRGQRRLALPDLMQDLQRVQGRELRPEGPLDLGRDRGMSQEAVARGRGLVVPLRDLGSVPGPGQELERRLEIIY